VTSRNLLLLREEPLNFGFWGYATPNGTQSAFLLQHIACVPFSKIEAPPSNASENKIMGD